MRFQRRRIDAERVRTASDHAIGEVAGRLVDAVVEPFEIDGREVLVTASVGVAVSERGGEAPEELLRDADAAMYRAKELGDGRFEAFDVALRHRLVERMSIEGGLIVPMGSWVLIAVCAQLARWPEAIRVSANLSTLQIRPELVDEVEQQLARHAVAPGRLVLEITESLVLDPRIKPIVASLRALGVQLALDDFGTGYSSLGSLQRFPLDLVKLDRTLIESLAEGTGVAVVRAAVELGQALGMHVVAEGIEGRSQLHQLRELGCPLGQGFLFARPLQVAEAQLLLEASTERTQATRDQAA